MFEFNIPNVIGCTLGLECFSISQLKYHGDVVPIGKNKLYVTNVNEEKLQKDIVALEKTLKENYIEYYITFKELDMMISSWIPERDIRMLSNYNRLVDSASNWVRKISKIENLTRQDIVDSFIVKDPYEILEDRYVFRWNLSIDDYIKSSIGEIVNLVNKGRKENVYLDEKYFDNILKFFKSYDILKDIKDLNMTYLDLVRTDTVNITIGDYIHSVIAINSVIDRLKSLDIPYDSKIIIESKPKNLLSTDIHFVTKNIINILEMIIAVKSKTKK